jgi:hypothetical protein
MNVKRFKLGLMSGAMIIALAAAIMAQTTTESKSQLKTSGKKGDITGTWLVNLNVNGGAAAAFSQTTESLSSAAVQAPFIALETFHSDGTFIETSLIDYIAPQGPPGQGVWEKTGSREFALTIYGVIIGTVTNPQFEGTYKVRSRLTLNNTGEEFSGPFKIEIFDPAGNSITTLDGTAQGRRAKLETLP